MGVTEYRKESIKEMGSRKQAEIVWALLNCIGVTYELKALIETYSSQTNILQYDNRLFASKKAYEHSI